VAILYHWPGFSCDDCESYRLENLDMLDLAEQGSRCRALLYAIGAVRCPFKGFYEIPANIVSDLRHGKKKRHYVGKNRRRCPCMLEEEPWQD
jgi:hypothetical protein